MSKFIIGFYGASNNGKTSSLKALISLFAKEHKISYHSDTSLEDQIVTFDYKGVKVGIATDGDYKETISGNIELLIKEKCDMIITACRTWGGTHDAIDAHKNSHEIHYITCPYLYFAKGKPSDKDFEKLNAPRAIFVKAYIDELIK